MKFTYVKFSAIGKSLIKYGIVFDAGVVVEVDDVELIKKLSKSPYLEFSESDEKPKRKYNKKLKVAKNETQDEPQAEAETTPETEVEDEAE